MASSLGQPLRRIEDADLLLGCGRFADDLPVRPGTWQMFENLRRTRG